MAKKVVYVDDLSGEEIDKDLGGGPMLFEIDGERYIIDLGVKNRDAFKKAVQKYIAAARKPTEDEDPFYRHPGGKRAATRGPKVASAPGGSGLSKEQLTAIREWAQATGWTNPKT